MDFRILGPLEVRDAGEPLTLGGQKQLRLLAILLLHANEPVHVDELLDELWPYGQPSGPAHALEQLVSQLRKSVGREVVERLGEAYRLRVARRELDSLRFYDLVE